MHRVVEIVNGPEMQLVVVASARQLLRIEAPFEPTDLLFMPHQSRQVIPHISYVSVQNLLVPRPGAEQGPLAPVQRSHSTLVPEHRPHQLTLVSVPDLDNPAIRPNG